MEQFSWKKPWQTIAGLAVGTAATVMMTFGGGSAAMAQEVQNPTDPNLTDNAIETVESATQSHAFVGGDTMLEVLQGPLGMTPEQARATVTDLETQGVVMTAIQQGTTVEISNDTLTYTAPDAEALTYTIEENGHDTGEIIFSRTLEAATLSLLVAQGLLEDPTNASEITDGLIDVGYTNAFLPANTSIEVAFHAPDIPGALSHHDIKFTIDGTEYEVPTMLPLSIASPQQQAEASTQIPESPPEGAYVIEEGDNLYHRLSHAIQDFEGLSADNIMTIIDALQVEADQQTNGAVQMPTVFAGEYFTLDQEATSGDLTAVLSLQSGLNITATLSGDAFQAPQIETPVQAPPETSPQDAGQDAGGATHIVVSGDTLSGLIAERLGDLGLSPSNMNKFLQGLERQDVNVHTLAIGDSVTLHQNDDNTVVTLTLTTQQGTSNIAVPLENLHPGPSFEDQEAYAKAIFDRIIENESDIALMEGNNTPYTMAQNLMVQRWLNEVRRSRGLSEIAGDRIYGPQTAESVRWFQREVLKAPQTGIVDTQTLGALRTAAAEASDVNAAIPMNDDEVLHIQVPEPDQTESTLVPEAAPTPAVAPIPSATPTPPAAMETLEAEIGDRDAEPPQATPTPTVTPSPTPQPTSSNPQALAYQLASQDRSKAISTKPHEEEASQSVRSFKSIQQTSVQAAATGFWGRTMHVIAQLYAKLQEICGIQQNSPS